MGAVAGRSGLLLRRRNRRLDVWQHVQGARVVRVQCRQRRYSGRVALVYLQRWSRRPELCRAGNVRRGSPGVANVGPVYASKEGVRRDGVIAQAHRAARLVSREAAAAAAAAVAAAVAPIHRRDAQPLAR